MGIYLPIRFPKSCNECDRYSLNIIFDCYPDEYGEDSEGEKIICPLSEIDLVRCGECKYWVSAKNEWNGYCENEVDAFNTFYANDFCSYGERSNDE